MHSDENATVIHRDRWDGESHALGETIASNINVGGD
jgi:hypothetical protein